VSHRRLGIALGRHELAVAILEGRGRSLTVAWHKAERWAAHDPLAAGVRRLLEQIPKDLPCREVRVACSPRWLACADLVDVPYRSEAQIEAVAGSLAEGRSAGESAEDLAVDVVRVGVTKEGTLVNLHAIRHPILDQLRAGIQAALPSAQITTVTSTWAAVASCFSTGVLALAAAGEGLVVVADHGAAKAWRAFPLDTASPDARSTLLAAADGLGIAASDLTVCLHEQPLRHGALELEARYATAVMAALCETKACPNLLRGSKDAPRGLLTQVRAPLTAVALAATLLLAASAFLFHARAKGCALRLQDVETSEKVLWEQAFPCKAYRQGSLTKEWEATEQLRQKNAEVNGFPSALAFWSEIGQALPNADQMGMTLEALQLGPEGGRMTAKVETHGNDPLSQAAHLEHALNARERLSARGEFEAKDKEVLVRMRLDYRPATASQVELRTR